MMSRLDGMKASSLTVYPLSSSTSRECLSIFSQLLSSSIGPNGKNHIVRNACGGHMTITSSSSRLLTTISLSRSELKLVSSAIIGHLQQYGDGGLFMSHVCLKLTKSALDLTVNHVTVTSAFSSFMSIIIDYMKLKHNHIKVKVDFSNVSVLLAYVNSILSSKSLLNIQTNDLKTLSLTILNAFVKSIPSELAQHQSSGVYVIGLENQPVSKCKQLDGIVLEFPVVSNLVKLSDLPSMLQCKQFQVKNKIFLKIALITCSLSGDLEDVMDATFEGTEQQFLELDEHVLKEIESLINVLDSERVALVLCQKVIHPRLKTLLRSKGIIFVDRLGLMPIPFIQDLTGCQPITSVNTHSQIVKNCLGKLTSVAPHEEGNKEYIHLLNDYCNTNVVTLIIYAEWEERLSEMKQCVESCLKGLSLLAKEPWLLMGGGCWQMHCSLILQNKVLTSLEEMTLNLSCSEAMLIQFMSIFTSMLRSWGCYLKRQQEHLYFDSSSGHCWAVSKDFDSSLLRSQEYIKHCCCGFRSISVDDLQSLDLVVDNLVGLSDVASFNKHCNSKKLSVLTNELTSANSNNFVLDNYAVFMNALHKGTMTAGLLLSIGLLICDKN